jgi:hypothetical protein
MRSIIRIVAVLALLFTFCQTRLAHGQAKDKEPVPAPVQVQDIADNPKPRNLALENPVIVEGLKWLASKQEKDGSWTLGTNKIEGTSLALLPFLGSGQTHRGGAAAGNKYTKQIDQGWKFLVLKQSRDGAFDADDLVANALAALVICEAYGLTSDPALRGPGQRAANYIGSAQHEKGGWGKKAREEANTTSTAWNLKALKSAQMAGLNVPRSVLLKTKPFLETVATEKGSRYAEVPGGKATPDATAKALLCQMYLGIGPRNPGLLGGTDYLLKEATPKDLSDPVTLFFATQVMHHLGGERWEKWHPGNRDLLTKLQDQGKKNAADKGSWAPAKADDAVRLKTTSLALLTIEIYYRHLPLYRRDVGADKDVLK